MAKFKSSTFGEISGKHGNVVAVTMKDGTSYFREYIIPPNPNTIKQQTQRGKFGFVVKELNCMRKMFAVTFGGQYGINRAVSLAMKTCVSGDFPDFRIDYSRLQVAVGSLPLPLKTDIQKQASSLFKLTWSYDPLLHDNPDDAINIVLLNNSSKQVIFLQHIAARADGLVEFSIPESWHSAEIHIWIYFSNSNDNHFSDSKYLQIMPE